MREPNQNNNLKILSVSDLNNSAKRLLEKNYSSIWIQGEVTNFRAYDSGHWYFKIKDDSSEIQCVMFRFRNNSANMQPLDGDQLILNGSISMYVAKGTYQFQVDSIEYAGEGVLLKNFEDTTYSVESRVDDMMKLLQEGELSSINIIIKADTNGSVEALKDGLLKLSTEEIDIQVVHSGVGGIVLSDVDLASATQSIIVGSSIPIK